MHGLRGRGTHGSVVAAGAPHDVSIPFLGALAILLVAAGCAGDDPMVGAERQASTPDSESCQETSQDKRCLEEGSSMNTLNVRLKLANLHCYRVTAFPVGVATGSLQIDISGIPNTVLTPAVAVSGPGVSQSFHQSTALTNLSPGIYTIRASDFTTGTPGKPGCQFHTPDVANVQATVTAGHVATVSVAYASEPCDA